MTTSPVTPSPMPTTLRGLYRKEAGALSIALVFHILKYSGVWMTPILTAAIIDLIANPQPDVLPKLWFYTAVFVIIYIQNIPTNWAFAHFIGIATRNIEMNLRSAVAWQLQRLSMSFFKRNSSGALQTKLLRDVETIEQMTKLVTEIIPIAAATIFAALVVTAIRAPWFLVFFVLMVPMAVFLSQAIRKPLGRRNRAFRQEIEELSNQITEMIRLVPITRAHGIENAEMLHLQIQLERVRQTGMALDRTNGFYTAGAWVTFRLFDVLCLVVAAYCVYTRLLPITVGDVVMLTGFFGGLTNAVSQLISMLPQISRGLESYRSLTEILESSELEPNAGKRPVTAVNGYFCFENVAFRYSEQQPDIVANITLEIQPGEVIGLVGQSGAGKSTLLNLIIGFLRPTVGRILLDGQDMNDLDLRTFRQFLSVVTQNTVLFNGSIGDNVAYGGGKVPLHQIEEALRDANLLDFVQSLPKGLETLVGEDGLQLSGGQRQRIAIARALIRNPRVLILDEATSALDSASESTIQEALERLMKGRTTFIVAHRLSTIRNADRIIVMDQGKIVEIGSHVELMAHDQNYAHLQRSASP